MRPWTLCEIRYLDEHAQDGAEAVAKALKRSVSSVQVQASRRGLSLAVSWICPRCGARSRAAPNASTGWCPSCTKAARRERIQREVAELEERVAREEAENRKRQALYAKRYRLRKKSKALKRK